MARRAVVVTECDNCEKKVEREDVNADLPRGWKHLFLSADGVEHEFDVCSAGCGDKVARSFIQGVYLEEEVGADDR